MRLNTAAWDFWSLSPESLHQVTVLMFDRGLPTDPMHVNGYGSHTFSFWNAAGGCYWVKFHFKTAQGYQHYTNAQAAEIIGKSRDTYQEALFGTIERGETPKWCVMVQIMPEAGAQTKPYNPFDLTKVWPHSDYPLAEAGIMELNRNVDNYFTEIEQVAMSPSNVVPGIGFSPDKMLQARIFSYADAHRYRLGAYYEALPVNAPKCLVHHYHKDGTMCFFQNDTGNPDVYYEANSFNGPTQEPAVAEPPLHISGKADRYNHCEDDDYYSQPRAFVQAVLCCYAQQPGKSFKGRHMNIRDLRYAIALAEYRHFNKAADACYVSQPTLSGQIKKLEDELGVVLFERSKRSVDITPIGEKVVAHAKRVMEEIEIIESVAKDLQDPFAEPLRLGIIPTLAPYLLPLILEPLRNNYPQFQLIIREEITESLLTRLDNHDLDAILIATRPEPDMAEQLLFEEPFWLAHPAKHPFYEKEEITTEDLSQDELLLLTDGHCLREQVSFACQFKQNQGKSDLRASSLETLMQLVGAGFGYTLVPALALRGSWASDSGVVMRKMDIPGAMRQIRLVTRKTFTRMETLHAVARHILLRLPNTVNVLAGNEK